MEISQKYQNVDFIEFGCITVITSIVISLSAHQSALQRSDEYLDYRQKFGEKIEDKSPLIRERFDILTPFIVQAPKFLSKLSMSLLFEDILKRSGVNQIKPGHKRREVRTSHGFRNFYINQSKKANINYTTWKCLVGHKLRKVDAAYKRTTEEDMLAEYVKAISLLTFDPNITLREKVKELESERLKTIDEYHDKWLDKLKQEYSLIPVLKQEYSLIPVKWDQESCIHAKESVKGKAVLRHQ